MELLLASYTKLLHDASIMLLIVMCEMTHGQNICQCIESEYIALENTESDSVVALFT